jgi:transcriptional regulator of arginine metabolism
MTEVESRPSRLALIEQILQTEPIDSQASLADRLAEHGVHVTQPSLSRDLQALGAGKVEGRYVVGAASWARLERQLQAIGDVRIVEAGPHMLVARCPIGAAPRLGLALDEAGLVGVAGTIAGDDTVFIALTDPGAAGPLRSRLESATRGRS